MGGWLLRRPTVSCPIDRIALPGIGADVGCGRRRVLENSLSSRSPLEPFVQCVSLATSFMEDQVPRGHYYGANWNYRLDYSLSGQIHLFWKYLSSGEPARLGLGWDRWFVFLHKGGVSAATLTVLGLCMAAGLGISVFRLKRQLTELADNEWLST